MRTRKFGWVLLAGILVLINIAASFLHYRLDLTEEKRYSLSEPTKRMLRELPQPVRVEVFMKGEFPAGFRKLATSVEEFLQECREYSGGRLDYTFIDPLDGLDDTTAARLIDSVNYYYEIPAFTLRAPGKVGDEQTQKLVLPGAVVYYGDTTTGVNLLSGQRSFGTEPEQLAALYNNIEASMEYKFASAIQKISMNRRPTIGYALGNGEGWGFQVDDMVRTLIRNYDFDTINLKEVPFIPPFEALVIAKPTERFEEAEKIKLDQYVTHGGKIFWMVDNMYAEFDSLYKSGGFIAFDRGLNLEDLLFNYGVRINQTLVQDMQSDQLPQVSTNGSNQQRMVSWPFFPVLNGTDHPISKNLEPVRALFPTALDTVEANGIAKIPLLQSSNNARLLEAPAKIDFEFLQIAPDEREFTKGPVTVAFLLEGKFRSLYANRIPRQIRDSFAAMQYPILTEAAGAGKMIVASDGDLAMNQYSPRSGPLPMGTNVFTQFTFANKEFFLNSLEHLVNPSDILQTRSKSLTLRLLDPQKTGEERSKWQLINIGLPLIILIIAALIYYRVRRHRFASVSSH